jgi:hypothetical protein
MAKRQINNFKIEPILIGGSKKKALGYKLFDEAYANIAIFARKKSGKTVNLYNIIDKIANKHTTVLFLVATFDKDDVYKEIRKKLDSSNIPYESFDTFNDLIDRVVNGNEDLDYQPTQQTTKRICDTVYSNSGQCFHVVKQQTETKIKPKKSKKKYISPEYVIVSDDQGDLNKNKMLTNFLKKNRHYKCKNFIISQDVKDLNQAALKQLDYILLYAGISEDRLKHLHEKCQISIEFDKLKEYYALATEKPYSFLYIDIKGSTFRINYNTLIM